LYGWRIVAVCFITHCLNVGTVFYGFGVFFHPLSLYFGWTRAQTSWGFSLAAVLGAFYAIVLGRFVDRYGPRPVHALGVPFVGWIHDRTGSYQTAFVIVLLTTVAAAACITGIRGSPPRAAREGG
jgi:MFS family permease